MTDSQPDPPYIGFINLEATESIRTPLLIADEIRTTGYVTPNEYGAVGDGVADDSDAIATVLALPDVAVRGIPGQIYRIGTSKTVRLPDNANFDLSLYVDCGSATGLTIGGYISGSDKTLVGAATAGSYTLALSDVSGLTVGQWVKVWSTRWYDASRTQTEIGELQRIAGIYGTTLVFETALEDSYRTDRLGQFTISNAGTGYVAGDFLFSSSGTPSLSWTMSSVNTTTGVMTLGAAATGLYVGMFVALSNSGGALPTGYSSTTLYRVGSISGSTVVLYANDFDAINSTSPVVPSTGGSGTTTLYVPQAFVVTSVSGAGAIQGMEWAGAPYSDPTYSVLPSGALNLLSGTGSSAQITVSAEVPALTPIAMASNVRGNLVLQGNLAAQQQSGVDVVFCYNANITHTTSGFTSAACGLSDCAYSTNNVLFADDSYPGNSGYGSYQDNSSRDCVTNIDTARGVRHAFTTGNASNSPGCVTRAVLRFGTLSASPPAGSPSYELTVTNVNTSTGVITTSPGASTQLSTGQQCYIQSTATLPSGLLPDLLYWVNVSGSTLTLYSTYANSIAATSPIVPTTSGTGVVEVVSAPGGDMIKTHAACRSLIIEGGTIDSATGGAITIENASSVVNVNKITRSRQNSVAIGNYTSRLGSYVLKVDDLSDGVQAGVNIYGAASPMGYLSISGRYRDNGYQGISVNLKSWARAYQVNYSAVVMNNCRSGGSQQVYNTQANLVSGNLVIQCYSGSGTGVQYDDCCNVFLDGALIFFPAGATGLGAYFRSPTGIGRYAYVSGVMVRGSNASNLRGIYLDDTATYVTISADNRLDDCTTAVRLGSGTGNVSYYGASYAPTASPTFTGQVTLPNGTVSAPGAAIGGSNQGIYGSAGAVNVGVAGAQTAGFLANEMDVYGNSAAARLVLARSDNPGVTGAITDTKHNARNSSGTYFTFAEMVANADTATAGSETGRFRLSGRTSGASTNWVDIDGSGVSIITGTIKFADSSKNTTGAGSAALGANSPAVTLTAPYKWVTVVLSDNSTGYIPVWK